MALRSLAESPGARLGAFVRQARLTAGLSQEELGAKVRKAQRDISALERGRNAQMPRPEELRAIIDAVGASMEEALQYVGYLDDDHESAANVYAAIEREVRLAEGIGDAERSVILQAIAYAKRLADIEAST